MAPSKIQIIRHGEKPSGKTLGYSDPSGTHVDSHSLTMQGWARAAGLVQLFNPLNKQPRAGLGIPTHIYVADGEQAGERMKETGSLLAKSLGLTMITTFDKGKEKDLVKTVLALPASAVVLIVWEHSKIADIVKAFAKAEGNASPKPPKSWDDKRFDLVWVFTPGAKGWSFSQVPELILPSDSGKAMKLSWFGQLFG